MKIKQLFVFIFTCLLSILSFVVDAQPFVISADGSEVTDQKTGLIWKRCSEGMAWNGTTCAGAATLFRYETALAHARTLASSTGVGWRVPNIKELASIIDKSRINPAIDATAFPATNGSGFWSSTPYVRIMSESWIVHFAKGGGSKISHTDPIDNYLRLVRAGQ